MAAALAGIGLGFPAPNRVLAAGGARIAWAGREAALLIGAAAPDLGAAAAVTAQEDGWAGLRLTGPAAAAVLRRGGGGLPRPQMPGGGGPAA